LSLVDYHSALDHNTVVHVWKAKSTLDGVLAAGYHALLSNEDQWYLEYVTTSSSLLLLLLLCVVLRCLVPVHKAFRCIMLAAYSLFQGS
jgi:hypothetical protein